jgi:aquaporin Z
MMSVVIFATTRPRLMPWTGVLAGALVALWITFEAPISGMSMNPARSFATAAVAGQWSGWWIYFVAPPLGMLAAVEASRLTDRARSGCAKLHHPARVRCIFCGQPGSRGLPVDGASAGVGDPSAPPGTLRSSPALSVESSRS